MVKLNIEMTMASLIKKIALTSVIERDKRIEQFPAHETGLENGSCASTSAKAQDSSAEAPKWNEDRTRATTEVHIRIEEVRESELEIDGSGEVGDRYGFERRV
jgi:hypothetical protein